MRAIAAIMAAFVHPIAWVGWGIEHLVGRLSPGWQFGPLTATPYFLAIVFVATAGVLSESPPLQAGSAYLLSALEVLGIWCSATVALGKPTAPFLYLRRFGLRRGVYPDTLVLLRGRGLYMVIMTYMFTIYYFGAVYFLLSRYYPESFVGLFHPSKLEQFVTALYFSGITITTLGYADVYPHATVSRLIVLVEVFVGLSFSLFVFAAFVAFHVNRLTKEGE